MTCALTNLTQIVGPQVYLARENPAYHTGMRALLITSMMALTSFLAGLYVDIACWCLLFIMCLVMGFHLKALNRKQQQRRIALGRTGDIKDPSIMSLEEAKAYRLELKEALRAEGRDIDDLNLDAFADLTDRENPDFFYVSMPSV